MAQGGPSPYWALLTTLVVLFGAKYRVIVVTDKQVHVFKQSMWKAGQPKGLLASLPAGTTLNVSNAKLWGKLHVNGERLWVHRRFHGDVASANRWSKHAAES